MCPWLPVAPTSDPSEGPNFDLRVNKGGPSQKRVGPSNKIGAVVAVCGGSSLRDGTRKAEYALRFGIGGRQEPKDALWRG